MAALFLCISYTVLGTNYAQTGPLQKIRVHVVQGDTIPCGNDFTLQIVSVLDPVIVGTATVAPGGFIEFMPSANCRDTVINIAYTVSCPSALFATDTLQITVTNYNLPTNIIDKHVSCYEIMPKNVLFGTPREKFSTASTTGDCVDGFSVPLVGDLNGDKKPEIVAMGVTQAFTVGCPTTTRYINIYNGQTGVRMMHFDLGTGTATNMGDPYHRAPAQFALADVDNDGIAEIIVALTTNNGIVRCYKPIFSGTTITALNLMWQAPVTYALPNNASINNFGYPHPYIADLNGDGSPEIIIYNKIYNGATGDLIMSWGGPAPLGGGSSSTTTGLTNTTTSATPTALTQAVNTQNSAMTGRRMVNGTYGDEFLNVLAIVDIDGCGQQEIITGNRIYKFTFNSLTNHTLNTYTTIEGPDSVKINEDPAAGTKKTHYLSDGLTRVADIDGDGYLDIVVNQTCNNGDLKAKVLIWIWDPRFPTVVKAAITYYSDGYNGSYGIPFIGDINGKKDGWDGTGYNLKLPEICLITGGTYIDRVTGAGTNLGRSGVLFHPLSDDSLRKGANTLANTVATAGWNNNNTANTFRHFNRLGTDAANAFNGHVVAFTYDAQATNVEERLKISWALEHTDRSHSTSMTLFDFDNNGTMDICYRDETTLRVISPAVGGPSGTGKDYVTLSENTSTPGTSIMFSTNVFSGTAFEYPVIADVNMDASADIVVMQSASSQSITAVAGYIRVFEYNGNKWAPCPPVWNQSMYDPTQVREDLKINARPQSMLTPYTIGTDTIHPFNGSWVQQPIVKDGSDYVPVVRHPDAILNNMEVKVLSTTSTTVTLGIVNKGSATIAASAPITFYNGGTIGNSLASSTLIGTQAVGIDIFPEETDTITFTISGNFNNCLIWARIMDDGRAFPALGYEDCDTSNNTLSGIDCPYLTVKTTALPKDTICGIGGTIQLSVTNMSGNPFTFAHTPSFKWYRNDVFIPTDTNSTLRVSQSGTYYCWVTDGICIKRTQSVNVVIDASCINITDKNLAICSNTAFRVTPNSGGDIVPAGTTYTWEVSTPNANITGASAQTVPQASISQVLNNTTSSAQSLTYTVTPIIGVVGTGTPFRITVTVNPTASITAKTAAICSGSTFLITPTHSIGGDSIPIGTTYTWTVPTNSVGATNQSVPQTSISQTLTNAGSTAQNVTYTVTATSGTCTSTFTITVTVNIYPALNTEITGPHAVCVGNTIQLSNTTTGGVWTISNSNAAIANPIANPEPVTGAAAGNSYVTYTLSNGQCESKKTFLLKVVPTTAPTVKIGFEK